MDASKLLTITTVYSKIKKHLYPHFTSSEKKIWRLLNISRKKENESQFYADLSRLLINMLVTRIIRCSISNINSFIIDNSLTEKTFIEAYNTYSEEELKKLIAYDILFENDTSFTDSLQAFRKEIAADVLCAYDIQRADAKGSYVIKKLAQAYYANPHQLPDECIIDYAALSTQNDCKTMVICQDLAQNKVRCFRES